MAVFEILAAQVHVREEADDLGSVHRASLADEFEVRIAGRNHEARVIERDAHHALGGRLLGEDQADLGLVLRVLLVDV